MGVRQMTNKEMIQEITRLKKEKNAVLLAHYYQIPEIQDIADYIGDSLYLSQIAAKTDADIIVFAGVHFMAETAKILSPHKKVLLPAKDAGCPMADMATAEKLREYKEANPDRFIICYVNSTAEVKAESDVCVTSSNALQIMTHYKDKKLMYVPDQNSGRYVKEAYNLDMDLWPGFCRIHHILNLDDVQKMQEAHPNAELIIHPESPLEVVKKAAFVGSTKGLLNYVIESDHTEFIIGTERGILHAMQKACPDKTFHLLSPKLTCRNMKKTRLVDIYNAFTNETHEINVDEDIAKKAKHALDKMLGLS